MVSHTPSLPAATVDVASAAFKTLLGERFHQSLSSIRTFLATEGHSCHTPPWAVAQRRNPRKRSSAFNRSAMNAASPSSRSVPARRSRVSWLRKHAPRQRDMRGMNRVLGVDMDNMTVRVQCGVTRLQLEAELKSSGLFFLSILAQMRPWAVWPPPGLRHERRALRHHERKHARPGGGIGRW